MTKRLLLLLTCASLVFSTGCLFSRKERKPKESSAIASEVEETFRRRWVDQRITQLTAQGRTPDVARTQAEAEFREKYAFGKDLKK